MPAAIMKGCCVVTTVKRSVDTGGSSPFIRRLLRELPLHLYLLPAVVLVILFSYVPMVGAVIAFQNFTVFKGWFNAPWIGLDNFRYVMEMPGFTQVLFNTVYISALKIIFSLAVPIVVALLLNEVESRRYKRALQTVMYMPHFMSWVILGGVVLDLLSSEGVVNSMIHMMGGETVYFLTDNRYFRSVLVITEVWKTFGFNTIVYMAALTSISPSLYEAAVIDGANRLKQTRHITLPGILPVIVLLATLRLGDILNAGFDQVYMLLNALVMDTGDIIDTLVFRMAFDQAQYSVATAVGMFKSAVSLILIAISYFLVYRYADYRIF